MQNLLINYIKNIKGFYFIYLLVWFIYFINYRKIYFEDHGIYTKSIHSCCFDEFYL